IKPVKNEREGGTSVEKMRERKRFHNFVIVHRLAFAVQSSPSSVVWSLLSSVAPLHQ
ncbi:hypothetical protein Csa_023861, partial [Cucumis sativus]